MDDNIEYDQIYTIYLFLDQLDFSNTSPCWSMYR